MTHVLAELTGTLRFRSTSGRTELTDDPDGYRLHVTGGTDLLDEGDAHALVLALTATYTQYAALRAAGEVASTVDPYPYLLPWQPEDELTCGACGRTCRRPLYPWWDSDGANVVMVGPGCFRKRLTAIRHRRDVRSGQLALTTGEAC